MSEVGRKVREVSRVARAAPLPALIGVVVLPVVHVLLRTQRVSYRSLRRRLANLSAQPPAGSGSPAEGRVVAEGVFLVWRLYRTSCLARSLLTWWLCRRRGIDADLRFGMSATGERHGHAWVEVAGVPIDDTPDVADRFVAFDQPGPADR